MTRKIFVGLDLPEELRRKIQDAAPRNPIAFHLCRTAEDYAAFADADVEVLLSRYTLPHPQTFPNLKWVQTCGAGVDHLAGQALAKTSTLFTTASGIHAACITEMVFAYILNFQRNFSKIGEYRRERKWPQAANMFEFFDRVELTEQTLVVVGLGAIGGRIAGVGKAFGMQVLGIRRRPEPVAEVDEVHGLESLPDLAARADYLVLSIPLTSATRGLVGREILGRMKPSAVVINIARGALLNEAALIEALSQGRIAGAGLDVFEREPLAADHPFYGMQNVIFSPHIAGATPRYDALVVDLFAGNLRRYLAGERLRNLVDWSMGY